MKVLTVGTLNSRLTAASKLAAHWYARQVTCEDLRSLRGPAQGAMAHHVERDLGYPPSQPVRLLFSHRRQPAVGIFAPGRMLLLRVPDQVQQCGRQCPLRSLASGQPAQPHDPCGNQVLVRTLHPANRS